jgi:hypothetical protein
MKPRCVLRRTSGSGINLISFAVLIATLGDSIYVCAEGAADMQNSGNKSTPVETRGSPDPAREPDAPIARSPPSAKQFQAGVGIGVIAGDADFQVNYRPLQTHYQFGYKYTRWTNDFQDPFTGTYLTNTRESLTGPIFNYLFHPESKGSFYLGISLLRWSRTETALAISAPSDTQSTTNLYFGGGYTSGLGNSGYYNLGIYISPTAQLNTQTAISSEQSNGNIDGQLQIGMAF